MNIVRDVFGEFLGMFLADARLTLSILLLVAVVAVLAAASVTPLVSGAVLLLGSVAILVETVCRGARGGGRR
jgi:hypothetical protein